MGTTMADSEKDCHRNHRNSSKLFFCFNFSSSSSSSMKITRSIFSPARHKDHPFPLTRRLTSNGSLKGAQSPFPNPTPTTTSKKRTALDNNPEPTSPKVTCIGQVRVKSKKKKQGRKLRTPSRRRSGPADESFRRMDNWGSLDLNSSKKTSFTENNNNNRQRTQRWVHLPLTICEGFKGFGTSSCFSSSSRGERESKRETEIEAKQPKLDDHVVDVEEEEAEEGRLSISVPPKNALLLMRCRSDPMRVAALSRRLLESPLPNAMNLEDEEEEEETHVGGGGEINLQKGNEHFVEEDSLMEDEKNPHFEEDDSLLMDEEIQDTQIDSTMAEEEEEEDAVSLSTASEKLIEESVFVRSDSESDEDDSEKESTKEIETVKVKVTGDESVAVVVVGSESEPDFGAGTGEGELPDCLLLMMREPKVSMEVSKETWVCTTDFKRILPDRRRPAPNKTLPDDGEDPKNKRVDDALTLSRPPPKSPAVKQRQQPQPARSSCSLPGPISTAQKLPRCNSEPRTAAAAGVKLIPSERCMWKSRKVEQLRQQSTTVGVGPAAGVGF